jgi:hypothetical protein
VQSCTRESSCGARSGLGDPAAPGGAGAAAKRSQAIATNAFLRHLRPFAKGDVRYVPTLDESIAELKATPVDEVKKFYADFYGASHGELAVVGDCDASDISATLSALFGGWKTPRPYVRVSDPFQAAPPINQSFATADKANAYFLAGVEPERQRRRCRLSSPGAGQLSAGRGIFELEAVG